MCTLSFVPLKDELLVAMNRDELRTRPPALPPRILELKGIKVIYPLEPAGGTWIACNAAGNVLALLNWNTVDGGMPGAKAQTRGAVIPGLIAETDFCSVGLRFGQLNLNGMLPFRLVVIFRAERGVHEWRWDGARRAHVQYSWVRRHWFSSSLSDALAERERSRTCEAAAQDSRDWDETWLSKIHRSHAPGPYSICVHRRDAATVSCTVVRCSDSSVSMGYLEGSPCQKGGMDVTANIALAKVAEACFDRLGVGR